MVGIYEMGNKYKPVYTYTKSHLNKQVVNIIPYSDSDSDSEQEYYSNSNKKNNKYSNASKHSNASKSTPVSKHTKPSKSVTDISKYITNRKK